MDEVKKICDEIIKHNKCPNCGGVFEQATCIYCGSVSDDMQKLQAKLTSILEKTNINEEILMCLYSLKSIKIPLVDKILEDNNCKERFMQRYSYVLKKRSMNEDFTKDDYLYIIYLMDTNNDIMEKQGKSYFINILIKDLITSKMDDVPIFDKKILIRHFTEFWMQQKLPNSRCVYDNLGSDVIGNALLNTITLNEIDITNFLKNGYYMSLLDTIFHECAHIYQNVCISEGNVPCYTLLLMTKEELISKTYREYYYDNYEKYSSEVDARFSGAQGILQYLHACNLTFVNSKYFEDTMRRESALINDESRILDGNNVTVSEIFDKLVINSDMLFQYPLLKLQYKDESGRIVKKTKKELEEDYQRYKTNKEEFLRSIANQFAKIDVNAVIDEQIDVLYERLFAELDRDKTKK